MASNLTLNNIVDVLRKFASDHKQVNSFSIGKFSEVAASGDIIYPHLYVELANSRFLNGSLELSLNILCADLVQESQDNRTEVHSDCLSILQDLHNFFKTVQEDEYANFTVNEGATIQPIVLKFSDAISGWIMGITLSIINDEGVCNIPISDFLGTNWSNADGSYFISNTSSSNHTILPGINTYTGGTAQAQTVNITGGTFNSLYITGPLTADTISTANLITQQGEYVYSSCVSVGQNGESIISALAVNQIQLKTILAGQGISAITTSNSEILITANNSNKIVATSISYSMTADDYAVFVDTAGAVIIDLPSSPYDGQEIWIKDYSFGSVGNLYINGNGANLEIPNSTSMSSSWTCTLRAFSGVWVYSSGVGQWYIKSFTGY